jgi:hypothetical protein
VYIARFKKEREWTMQRVILAASALLLSGQAMACGAGFCLADAGWDAAGGNTREGMTLGLRYEFLPSKQLRSGSRNVPNNTAATALAGDEITTTNRNYVANASYIFNPQWQGEVEIPLLQRDHQHGSATLGSPDVWNFSALGDVKVLSSYRLATDSPFSLRIGAKLPTGSITQTATDGVTPAERMFQPGTGSLDSLLGVTYQSAHEGNLRWFASGLWQQPLTSRTASTGSYQAGKQLALNAGMVYPLNHTVAFTAQANLHLAGRERGTAGNAANTGGTTLAISPGINLALTPDLHLQATLQVPVYQYVNGVQLTSKLGMSVGVSQRF